MTEKSRKPGVGPYLDLGFRFATAIAVGTGGGYWLDKKIETFPVFLIVGLLIGMTSGFLTLYRGVYPPDSQRHEESEG